MRARGQAAGVGIGANRRVGDHITARVIGISLGGICGAHAVGEEPPSTFYALVLVLAQRTTRNALVILFQFW